MGSSLSKPDREAVLGTPGMRGSKETWLFNGLLLRIIDQRTGTWAFYNNSKDYEFHIACLFCGDSTVDPLDRTSVAVQDDGILCETVVFPLETEKFIVGDVTGFESKIEARALTEEYFQVHRDLNEEKYYRRLIPPKASHF